MSIFGGYEVGVLFYAPNDGYLFGQNTGMRIPKFIHFRGTRSTNPLDNQIMQLFLGSGAPFHKDSSQNNEIICMSNLPVKCFFDGKFVSPNSIPYSQTPFPFL